MYRVQSPRKTVQPPLQPAHFMYAAGQLQLKPQVIGRGPHPPINMNSASVKRVYEIILKITKMNITEEDKIKYAEKKKAYLWDFVKVGQILIWMFTLNLFGFWVANIILVLSFIPHFIFRDKKSKNDAQKVVEPKE
ncbi:MAG TPA: hypothetical protein VIJ29_03315 [Candidatus Paceibacterota bacterium]